MIKGPRWPRAHDGRVPATTASASLRAREWRPRLNALSRARAPRPKQPSRWQWARMVKNAEVEVSSKYIARWQSVGRDTADNGTTSVRCARRHLTRRPVGKTSNRDAIAVLKTHDGHWSTRLEIRLRNPSFFLIHLLDARDSEKRKSASDQHASSTSAIVTYVLCAHHGLNSAVECCFLPLW